MSQKGRISLKVSLLNAVILLQLYGRCYSMVVQNIMQFIIEHRRKEKGCLYLFAVNKNAYIGIDLYE